MADVTQQMLSVDDKLTGQSRKLNQFVAATAAAISAVAAGTALAWTSPALPQLLPAVGADHLNSTTIPLVNGTASNSSTGVNGTQFYTDLCLSDDEGSWVGSLLAIGALAGAVPIGMATAKFGRRKVLLALAVPFFASWLLTIFAQHVAMLYVARLFVGFAIGGTCVTAPMYIGEIAETSIRGALGAFFQLFLTIGILMTFVIGGFTYWRTLSIVCGAIPVLFFACFWWMPETPVFELTIHRKREAERALRWLRGPNYDIEPEIQLMHKELEEIARNKAGVKELLSNRASVMALVCSLGLMFFQQFSGINAVIFYTESIFKSAGSDIEPSIAAIIVGVVQTLATGIASLTIEKAGRKILLLVSASIMGLCLIALGIYFKLKDDQADVSQLGWLPLASLVLFIIAFSVGFGPIPWMMMSELFSAEFKGAASGIAVMFNWCLVFIVTKCFPIMKDTIGGAPTFWIFAGFCAAGVVFTIFLIPETKGKTSLEIQAILSGRK